MKKSDSSIRICCNFKNTINSCLRDDSDKFDLPVTQTLFHEIGLGNEYFASLDLAKGYWQFEIEPEDQHKTSFTFNSMTYCFTRLPFGLQNSADIFCRCISTILTEIKNKMGIKNFVDDVLIHSRNFEQYFNSIRELLELFRKYNLKLNGKKCSFLDQKVKFLGRIISAEGYSADPENVEAIKELNPPRTKKELLTLNGRFVWLREFISSNVGEEVATFAFSNIMKEMTKLSKGNSFLWTEKAQVAFEAAKIGFLQKKLFHLLILTCRLYLSLMQVITQ